MYVYYINNLNKNMERNIQKTRKLLKLRSFLENISQISWEFSVLNKRYPIHHMADNDYDELIAAYEDLVLRIKSFVKSEYGNEDNKN